MSPSECLLTGVAFKVIDPSMRKFMCLEMTSLRDNLLTDDAFEWLTSCMKLIMYLQCTFKRVGLSTFHAGIIIFITISMSTIIILV